MSSIIESIKNNKVIIAILSVLLMLIVWQVVCMIFSFPTWILPSPIEVFKKLVVSWNNLYSHALVTLYEAVVGLLLALVISIILAIILDSISILNKLLYPFLIASQAVPIVALAPLFLIWFGFGILPKVLVAAFICFFPIVISLLQGLSQADQRQIDLLKSMGASKKQIFRLVKLPSALPGFFGGLKIAVAYSITGAVVGEWLGSTKGLGMVLVQAQKAFQMDLVFAVIIIIVVGSLVLFAISTMLQRAFLPWQRKSKEIWQDTN